MKASRHLLLYFSLLAFLATRAIVPVGFMPSAIGSGFALCPGNFSSAQLIAVDQHHIDQNYPISQSHPTSHSHSADQSHSTDHNHHGKHHSQHSADSDCPFAVLGFVYQANAPTLTLSPILSTTTVARYPSNTTLSSLYQRPSIRAPPQLIS